MTTSDEKKRDEALKRALQTPHKKHGDKIDKPPKKKATAKPKTKGKEPG